MQYGFITPKGKKGFSPKFACDWGGPYLVVKRINELLDKVRTSPNAKSRVVIRNRSTRYLGID